MSHVINGSRKSPSHGLESLLTNQYGGSQPALIRSAVERLAMSHGSQLTAGQQFSNIALNLRGSTVYAKGFVTPNFVIRLNGLFSTPYIP